MIFSNDQEYFRSEHSGGGSCFKDALRMAGMKWWNEVEEWVTGNDIREICDRNGLEIIENEPFKNVVLDLYEEGLYIVVYDEGIIDNKPVSHAELITGNEIESNYKEFFLRPKMIIEIP